MPLKIITTGNARKDIQQAIDWENSRSENLGARFLEHLNLRIETLALTPFIGSVRYENVRCTTIKVFQYIIHYTVSAERQQLVILRVLHIKRAPIW